MTPSPRSLVAMTRTACSTPPVNLVMLDDVLTSVILESSAAVSQRNRSRRSGPARIRPTHGFGFRRHHQTLEL